MKNKITFFLFIMLLFSFSSRVSAGELCSSNGYTVVTINGIFTDELGAKYNKNKLAYKFSDSYNNQPLKVDYFYNATHLGGVGDVIDAVGQGVFDQKSDYDLVEMINDASQKINTQKILLVAHSQGNFYANNFFDKIASKPGGVPEKSMGVYGVASPANRVAGNGKYLTSDTDSVIAATVARFINILPPNIHIPLQSGDGNGHSFGDVYLKYKSERIVSDIKSLLNKLQNNDEQEINEPCISVPEPDLAHKVQGVVLSFADFVIDGVKSVFSYIANGINNVFLYVKNLLGLRANVIESLNDEIVKNPSEEINKDKKEVKQKDIKENIKEDILEKEKKEKKEIEDIKITLPIEIDKKDTTKKNNDVVNNNGNGTTGGGGGTTGGGSGGGGSGGSGGGGSTQTDTTAPVITINGANPMSVQKGGTYTEQGATATDAIDGVRSVTITGNVNTSVVASYNIVYTAKDLSNNVATAVRVVNVIVNNTPTGDTTPPIITILGDNPEIVVLNSVYTDAGATATDAIDGVRSVEKSGNVDTTKIGNYFITYRALDVAGNIATAVRTVKVVGNKYISKYSFGKNNGDGNNWLVWSFNGSYVYDWSDTYVNNYLREQFKIKTNTSTWCSQCLQRGIFTHDPRQGFNANDFTVSSLEGNPQNNMNGLTYDVVLQWDATGYTYTISHDSIVDITGHTDVSNMNHDLWVGWDGSFNNFLTFPSGNWEGTINSSPLERTGGGSMILEPYPVYKQEVETQNVFLSLAKKDIYAGRGINPTRGRKNLTNFDFQVIYTDKDNNAPQNVKLHIKNTTTGENLSETLMQKMSSGGYSLSDEDFSNGEAYVVKNLTYDAGDYDYYFSALDGQGNTIRIPENNKFLNFTVIPSTYTYIPKYSFGTENDDGHDWEVWAFNGSYVYDWNDTYVGPYLKEEFKIKTGTGAWCSQCLQRGIFNHDPKKGFESYDVVLSSLENNPQNNMNNTVYDVSIEWDSGGYEYTISHGGTIDANGHTDVENVKNDLWVGWDGSFNNFTIFPSGDWQGFSPSLPSGYVGAGGSMMLKPYKVYDESQNSNLSSLKKITKFNFSSLVPEVVGKINENDHTIILSVPEGADVTNITPTIKISNHASVIPEKDVAQNFTNPVTYTVIAQDGSSQNYIISVNNSNTPPDGSTPSITSYTFNGNVGDISINPSSTPLSLVLNASENVNWMSIKIEKEDNDALYKLFYSGNGCVDGTNICEKTWDGTLSGGDSLQNGVYRVKVHMQDTDLNDFNDYLLPYKINVNIGT